MCDAIFIGNTQQIFKKRMDGHFSDLQRLLKNGQKSDSFSAHFVQQFNTTTSCTDLHKYMTFKVVKQLNPIGAMKPSKITKLRTDVSRDSYGRKSKGKKSTFTTNPEKGRAGKRNKNYAGHPRDWPSVDKTCFVHVPAHSTAWCKVIKEYSNKYAMQRPHK